MIKPFLSNKDLVQRSRNLRVIDFHDLDETQARELYPTSYQRVYDTVRPFRLQNRDAQRQRRWWLFGRSNEKMRASLRGLRRYVVTPEVAKHRPFVFVDGAIIPDASLYAIASDDAYVLGVLSSRIHTTWALATGGKLGVGNDPRYQNTQCFDPFPFPVCSEELKRRIRELAETLDAHRKREQAQHPGLTITEMYNVLGSLRAREPLGERERIIHEQGLISVLKGLHDDLDKAVCDAYGWEHGIPDEEILQQLVALNHERAEEERGGLVRWLRPEYQHPQGTTQGLLDIKGEQATKAVAGGKAKSPFPANLAEQARAVRNALSAHPGVVTPAQLAKSFQRARVDRIEELLQTLVLLGQARQVEEGKYAA